MFSFPTGRTVSLCGHIGFVITSWSLFLAALIQSSIVGSVVWGLGTLGVSLHLLCYAVWRRTDSLPPSLSPPVGEQEPELLPERMDVSPGTRPWVRVGYALLGVLAGAISLLRWTPLLS